MLPSMPCAQRFDRRTYIHNSIPVWENMLQLKYIPQLLTAGPAFIQYIWSLKTKHHQMFLELISHTNKGMLKVTRKYCWLNAFSFVLSCVRPLSTSAQNSAHKTSTITSRHRLLCVRISHLFWEAIPVIAIWRNIFWYIINFLNNISVYWVGLFRLWYLIQ